MKAEEKTQRFHEALLQMLYPTTTTKDGNQKSRYALTEAEGSYSDQFPGGLKWERGSSSSSSSSSADEDDGDGDGPKKLTRAQRKRLRKKKLKEAASRRRKVIGPTLPARNDEGVAEANDNVADKEPPGVRQNVDYAPDIGAKNPESEAAPSCSKPNKQKHRRMAKKLAGERLKSSSVEDQGC